MTKVSCPLCSRMWFKMSDGEAEVEIKCQKCGHLFKKKITVNQGAVKMHNA